MKGNIRIKNQYITLTSIILALSCFGLLPKTQAVSPTPDGCYPGFTTAEGCNALSHLTSGAANTGLGWYALFGTSTGNYNTGVGAGALVLNNADSNTAVGTAALLLNTAGYENVAVGTASMVNNDTGYRNSAFGAFSLTNNVDGFANSAFGRCVLTLNVSASGNTGLGAFALLNNDSSGSGTANSNTAVGDAALMSNVDGASNTAVGFDALLNSAGDFNIALGAEAGTDPGIGSNNVYIGDPGFPKDINVISIGGIAASGTPYENTYIGGIYGASVNTATALPVYVDNDGHLGTSLVNASGQKMRMRAPQGAQPKASLSEFQKQQKRIAELETTVARLAATVKQQSAQIEKVSTQLELRKPARRVVVNKQ